MSFKNPFSTGSLDPFGTNVGNPFTLAERPTLGPLSSFSNPFTQQEMNSLALENPFDQQRTATAARKPFLNAFDGTFTQAESEYYRANANNYRPVEVSEIDPERMSMRGTPSPEQLNDLGHSSYTEGASVNTKKIWSAYDNMGNFSTKLAGWADISSAVRLNPKLGIYETSLVDYSKFFDNLSGVSDPKERLRLAREAAEKEEGRQLFILTQSQIIKRETESNGRKISDADASIAAQGQYISIMEEVERKVAEVESEIAGWKAENNQLLLDVSEASKSVTLALKSELTEILESQIRNNDSVNFIKKKQEELSEKVARLKRKAVLDASKAGAGRPLTYESLMPKVDKQSQGIDEEIRKIEESHAEEARNLRSQLVAAENTAKELKKQEQEKRRVIAETEKQEKERRLKITEEHQTAIKRNVARIVASKLSEEGSGLKNVPLEAVLNSVNLDEVVKTGKILVDKAKLRQILETRDGVRNKRMPVLRELLASKEVVKKDGKFLVYTEVENYDLLRIAAVDRKNPYDIAKALSTLKEQSKKDSVFGSDIKTNVKYQSVMEGLSAWDSYKKFQAQADAEKDPTTKNFLLAKAKEQKKIAEDNGVKSDDDVDLAGLYPRLRGTASSFKSMFRNMSSNLGEDFNQYMQDFGFKPTRIISSSFNRTDTDSSYFIDEKTGKPITEAELQAHKDAFMLRRRAFLDLEGQVDFKITSDSRIGGRILADAVAYSVVNNPYAFPLDLFGVDRAKLADNLADSIAEAGGTDAFIGNAVATLAPALAVGVVVPGAAGAYLSLAYGLGSQWTMTYGMDDETRYGMLAINVLSMGAGKLGTSIALKGAQNSANFLGRSVAVGGASGISSKTAGLTLTGFSQVGGGLASQYLTRESLFDENGNFLWAQFLFGTFTDSAMYLGTDVRAIKQLAKGTVPDLSPKIFRAETEGTPWGVIQQGDGVPKLVRLTEEAVSQMKIEAKAKGIDVEEKTVPNEYVIQALKTYEDSYQKNVVRSLFGANDNNVLFGSLGKFLARSVAETDLGSSLMKFAGYSPEALLNLAEAAGKIKDPNWISLDGKGIRIYNSQQMKDVPTMVLDNGIYNERRVSLMEIIRNSPANIHTLTGDAVMMSSVKKMLADGEIEIDRNGKMTLTKKGDEVHASMVAKIEAAKQDVGDSESKVRQKVRQEVEGKDSEKILSQFVKERLGDRTETGAGTGSKSKKRRSDRKKKRELAEMFLRSLFRDTEDGSLSAIDRAFRGVKSWASIEISMERFVGMSQDTQKAVLSALEMGFLKYEDGKLVSSDFTSVEGDVTVNFGNTNESVIEKALFDLGSKLSGVELDADGRPVLNADLENQIDLFISSLTDSQKRAFKSVDELVVAATTTYNKHMADSYASAEKARAAGIDTGIEHKADIGKAAKAFYKNLEDTLPRLPLEKMGLPASLYAKLKGVYDKMFSMAEDQPETMTSRERFQAAARRLSSGLDRNISIEDYPEVNLVRNKIDELSSLPDEFVVYTSPKKVLGIVAGRRSPRIFKRNASGNYSEYSTSPGRGGLKKVGDFTEESLRASLQGKEIASKGIDADIDSVTERLQGVIEYVRTIDKNAVIPQLTKEMILQNLKVIADGEGEFQFGNVRINVKDYQANSAATIARDEVTGSLFINQRANLLMALAEGSFDRNGNPLSTAGVAMTRDEVSSAIAKITNLIDNPKELSRFGFTVEEAIKVRDALNSSLGGWKEGTSAIHTSKLNTDRIGSVEGYITMMDSISHEFRHVGLLNAAKGERQFLSIEAINRILGEEEFQKLASRVRATQTYKDLDDYGMIHEIIAYGSNLKTVRAFLGREATAEELADFVVAYKMISNEILRETAGIPAEVQKLIKSTEDTTINKIVSENANAAKRIQEYENTIERDKSRTVSGGPETARREGRGGVREGDAGEAGGRRRYSDGDEFTGTGVREISSARITVGDSTEEGGVTKVSIRRTPGNDEEVQNTVPLKLLDIADDVQARALAENSGSEALRQWAKDSGYDGIFDSSKFGDSGDYEVSLFRKTEAAEGRSLKMADEEVDNLLISPVDSTKNSVAMARGKGIYKLSNSTSVDLGSTRLWDYKSGILHVQRDNTTENLIHFNWRAMRAFDILEADEGWMSNPHLLTGSIISGGFATPDRGRLAVRLSRELEFILEGNESKKSPLIVPNQEAMKKIISTIANEPYEQVVKNMRNPKWLEASYDKPDRPILTILHGRDANPTASLIHEGTHLEIMTHFGENFGLELFKANTSLNLLIGDATDIMMGPGSQYANQLNYDVRTGNPITAFDTAVHEIMATAVNKRDLSSIGFDSTDDAQLGIFVRAYAEIHDTISKSVGEGTAAEIARYMDPELVEKLYEIYPDKDKNRLLFGRSRLRALQESRERKIQRAAVREDEEGLPPGGISLKMADDFDSEFDALIGRLAPEGPTINGLPVNSKEVPWQVRRTFKDITEGGFLQPKVNFEESSYGFIANKMNTRLKAELKMTQDWLAQVESESDTQRPGRAPQPWWDKVALVSEEGEVLLKKPYSWSKYTKPLNGEKFGTRAEALEALKEKTLQHAVGQIREYQSALKWVADNGLTFGYNKKAAEQDGPLKMADEDMDYLIASKKRAEEIIMTDKVNGALFGNPDILSSRGVAGYLPSAKPGTFWRTERGEIFVNGKPLFDESIPPSIQTALLVSGVELGNFDYPKFKLKTMESLEKNSARVYAELQEAKNTPIRPLEVKVGEMFEVQRSVYFEQPMLGKVVQDGEGFVIRADDRRYSSLDGVRVADPVEGLALLRQKKQEDLQSQLDEHVKALNWVESNFDVSGVTVLPPDPDIMGSVLGGKKLKTRPDSFLDAVPSKSLKMADESIDSLLDRVTDPNTRLYPAETLIVNGYDPVTRAPNKKFQKTGAAKGSQWLKMLLDTPGVKKEAIQWGVGAWLSDPANANRVIKLSELAENTEKRAVKIVRVRKFEDIDPSYDPDLDNLHPLERWDDLTEGERKLIEPEVLERRRLKEENKARRENEEWSLISESKWNEDDWFVSTTTKKELAAIRAKREEMLKKYGSREKYIKAYQDSQDIVTTNSRKIYQLETRMAEKLGSSVTMRFGPEGKGQGDWWHGRGPKSPEEILFTTPTSLKGRPTFDSITVEDLPTGMEIYTIPSKVKSESYVVGEDGFSMEKLRSKMRELEVTSVSNDLTVTVTYKDGSTSSSATPAFFLNSLRESSRLMAQGLADPASTPVKLDVSYKTEPDRYFVAVKGQDLLSADVKTPQAQMGKTPDEAVQKYYRKNAKSSKDFHWPDDRNVVGWVRSQKLDVLLPNGKVVNTHMMTEVQSPHQGRNKNVHPAELFLELKQVKAELKTIDVSDETEMVRFATLSQRETELTMMLKNANVDIFGSSTWKEIGAKIFVSRAVESTPPGKDVFIAITDADAQVRRYGNKFRTRIDELNYEKVEFAKIQKKLAKETKLLDEITAERAESRKVLVSREWDTFTLDKKRQLNDEFNQLTIDMNKAQNTVKTLESMLKNMNGGDAWRVVGTYEGKTMFRETLPDKGSVSIVTHPEAMVPVSENISLRVFPDDIISEMRKSGKGTITGDEIVVGRRFYEDIYERDIPSIMKKLFGAEFEEGRSRTFTPSPWKSQVEMDINGRKVATDKVLVAKIPAEKADQIRKGMPLAMAENPINPEQGLQIRKNKIYMAPNKTPQNSSGPPFKTSLDAFEGSARWNTQDTEFFLDPANKAGFTVYNFLKDGQDKEAAFTRAVEELGDRPYVVTRGFWTDSTGKVHEEISLLVPTPSDAQSAYFTFVGLINGDQDAVIVSREGKTYMISREKDANGNVIPGKFVQYESKGRTREVMDANQYQAFMQKTGGQDGTFVKTEEGNYVRFLEDFDFSKKPKKVDARFIRGIKVAEVVSKVNQEIRAGNKMDPNLINKIAAEGMEMEVPVDIGGTTVSRKVLVNRSSVLDPKSNKFLGWVDDSGVVTFIDESRNPEKFNPRLHEKLFAVEKADRLAERISELYILSNPRVSTLLDSLKGKVSRDAFEAAKNAVLMDFELSLARDLIASGKHKDTEFYKLFDELMQDPSIMGELASSELTSGKSAMSLLTSVLSAALRVDANGVLAFDVFSRVVGDIAEGKRDVDYSYVRDIFQLRQRGQRGELKLDTEGKLLMRKTPLGEEDPTVRHWQRDVSRPEALQRVMMATEGYVRVKSSGGRGRYLLQSGQVKDKPKTYAEIAEEKGVKINPRSKEQKEIFVRDPLLVELIEKHGNPWLAIMEYSLIDVVGKKDKGEQNFAGNNTGKNRSAFLGDDLFGTKIGPFARNLAMNVLEVVYDINSAYGEAAVTGALKREVAAKTDTNRPVKDLAEQWVSSKRATSIARMQETARILSAETGELIVPAVIQQAWFDWFRGTRDSMKSRNLTYLSNLGFEESTRILKQEGMRIPENLPEKVISEFTRTLDETSPVTAISAEDRAYLNAFNYLTDSEGKSRTNFKLMMADDAEDPFVQVQRELVDADQKLAEGDADTWIKLASRHVQGGVLSDGEISAIKRMAERGDREALNKYVLGLSYISPVELVANLGRVTLLLGVKTVSKNIGGNSLRQIMEEISRAPAGLLDLILIQANSALGGKNTERSVTGLLTDPVATLRAYKDAIAKGLPEGLIEGVEVMRGTNEDIIFEHPSLFRERSTGRFYLKPLEIIEKYGWRFQGAMDRPFNAVAYYRALSELQTFRQREQAKLGNKISYDEAAGYLTVADQQFAEFEALRATFQEDNPIASKYYELIDGLPAFWRSMANTITKFVKTPLNVMDYVLDYTGFWPLAKLAVKEYNTQDWVDWKRSVKNIMDNPQDRKIISMAISKGAIGTLMFYIGSKMGEAGLISQFFDREEKKEGEQMEAKGTSFGEVVIGGKSIDISWLTPPAFYLIAGATAYQTTKDWHDKRDQLTEVVNKAKEGGDIDRIEKAEQELAKHEKKSPAEQSFTRVLKNFALQTPFLRQGLELSTMLEQGSVVSGVVEKWFSPDVLVPTILSEIAATKDEYERAVTDESILARMQERIQKKIPTLPGVSSFGKMLQDTGIPVVSGFGKTLTGREALPMRYDMFGRPIKSPSGIDPFKTKGVQGDKLTAEFDKFNVTIPPPTGANPGEENRLTKEKGEFFTPLLNNLIDTDEYKNSNDKVKKRILETAVRYISEEMRNPRLQPEDRKFNLRALAFRENLRDTLRSNPTSLFKENLNINDRDVLSAFIGAGLEGEVSFAEVINDLKRSGNLDRFLNDRLASSLLVGKGRSRRDAERNFEQLTSNPVPALIEWWAVGKRNTMSRDRNDQRREELRSQGKTDAEIEKILRKESARRGATTRRELKSFNSITVTK